MFDLLDDTNFTLYAAKYYTNVNCNGIEEFEEDLKRFSYIKRLLSKFKDKNEDLRERLILNHIIILYNIFESSACTRMLCYKLDGYLPSLKTFLLYLNHWPNNKKIGELNKVFEYEIPIEPYIANQLRKL